MAQEAMHCRSLEADELLNVRWAYDDPNPKVTECVLSLECVLLLDCVAHWNVFSHQNVFSH
jgi:hypothetical protein